MQKHKITEIQIFDYYDYENDCDGDWSANVAIDDEWMIQIGTDGEFSIPDASIASWNDDNKQDYMHDNINPDEFAKIMGLKADRDLLIHMGGEVMNRVERL